jgi:hypothetical protein
VRTFSTRAARSRPCILRSGEFGALQDRITANHPALIRSFLIDFDCPRVPQAVICAKFFHRADAFAANSVNAKWNARRAKNLPSRRTRNELSLQQKPLFHRSFFNFSGACSN